MTERMNEDGDIELIAVWRIFVKRKRIFFLMVGGALFISIVVSLVLPKIYSATASLLPPEESSPASNLIAGKLPAGLAGFAGGALGMKSPSARWVGILNSRTVFDALVLKFNLQAVYKKKTPEEAQEQLRRAVKISKSREDILFITVEDADPVRAAEIANAFVAALDKINQEIVTSAGGRMRVFIEGRLEEAEGMLRKSEEAVKAFQEKNGVVKLDAQSKAIIEAIGAVKGDLLAKEVALNTLLSYATPQNPQAKLLSIEVEGLRQAVLELEQGTPQAGESSNGLFIPTDRLPDLGLQYARLLRDTKIDETLYGLLKEQYEMARIQEAKDSPTIQVLDVAPISKKPVKPKKEVIVILSTFLAAFMGLFIIFLLEYLEKAKMQLENKDDIGEKKANLIRRHWGR